MALKEAAEAGPTTRRGQHTYQGRCQQRTRSAGTDDAYIHGHLVRLYRHTTIFFLRFDTLSDGSCPVWIYDIVSTARTAETDRTTHGFSLFASSMSVSLFLVCVLWHLRFSDGSGLLYMAPRPHYLLDSGTIMAGAHLFAGSSLVPEILFLMLFVGDCGRGVGEGASAKRRQAEGCTVYRV